MSEITRARKLADGAWSEVEATFASSDLFTDEREAVEALIASRRELHAALRALVDMLQAATYATKHGLSVTVDAPALVLEAAETLDRTSNRAITLVRSWAVRP